MSVLETLDFQPMLIVDMFRPHKGKRLVAAHRQPGKTPFVGGSESYNSITGFSDVDPLFPGGWITLVYNGSVGQTRLQPAPFFASDDVIALEPIAKNVSEAALLVCCAIIQRECVNKYSYGSKLNLQRLNRQTVMVPTTVGSDGTIEANWDGMDRLGAELLDQVVTHTHSARETRLADDDTLPELRFEPMFITDVFDSMKASRAWYDKVPRRRSRPEPLPQSDSRRELRLCGRSRPRFKTRARELHHGDPQDTVDLLPASTLLHGPELPHLPPQESRCQQWSIPRYHDARRHEQVLLGLRGVDGSSSEDPNHGSRRH